MRVPAPGVALPRGGVPRQALCLGSRALLGQHSSARRRSSALLGKEAELFRVRRSSRGPGSAAARSSARRHSCLPTNVREALFFRRLGFGRGTLSARRRSSAAVASAAARSSARRCSSAALASAAARSSARRRSCGPTGTLRSPRPPPLRAPRRGGVLPPAGALASDAVLAPAAFGFGWRVLREPAFLSEAALFGEAPIPPPPWLQRQHAPRRGAALCQPPFFSSSCSGSGAFIAGERRSSGEAAFFSAAFAFPSGAFRGDPTFFFEPGRAFSASRSALPAAFAVPSGGAFWGETLRSSARRRSGAASLPAAARTPASRRSCGQRPTPTSRAS